MSADCFTRIKRITTIASISLSIFIICLAGSTYISWSIFSSAYAENYDAMAAAGFQDILRAPGLVDRQIILLIITGPLVGLILLLPTFIYALIELRGLYEGVTRLSSEHLVDSDIDGFGRVSKPGGD